MALVSGSTRDGSGLCPDLRFPTGIPALCRRELLPRSAKQSTSPIARGRSTGCTGKRHESRADVTEGGRLYKRTQPFP